MLIGWIALLGSAAVAFGGPVTFTSKPTVKKRGDAAQIAFAVSAPTDVEVAVLDATNHVVRHLAAGMLGGRNPPPPPLQAGLSQSIAWMGRMMRVCRVQVSVFRGEQFPRALNTEH